MIVTAHAAFVLTGTVTTLLGPLLPVLATRWALEDASAGLLFTAQFAGSMAGVALSGSLVARLGFTRALAAGLIVMAAGVGALALAAWPHALLAVAGYGVGLGITIPATNLLVAEAAPHRRAAALNVLNLAWGMGAVAGPPIVAWFVARARVESFLFALAGALIAVLLVHAGLSPPARGRRQERDRPDARPIFRWRSPAFLTYAALFYVYVGTENAISGWVGRFASQLDAVGVAAATPALFWIGVLSGRAAAPLLLRRYDETRLVQGGLATAAGGVTILLMAASMWSVGGGAGLCGLGLSTVFPTTIAQLSRRFEEAGPRAAAAAFALAGLGGATVPWFVGVVSTAAGSLRTGLLVPLAGCLVMMALHRYRARRTDRTH